ncbi:phage baseplate assembly protein V [Terrarubrum flagellatum]|uniref:phage baseplate assembly protein V n=1 Tax=Terrirubrum flagellatum TaxID=2895980 RepID=UPI00314512F1
MSTLDEFLEALLHRVTDIERRHANMAVKGTVHEVNAEKQVARLKTGVDDDGKDVLGPWVPYAQVAGAMKIHSPPSVGQQMIAFNPSGEPRQGVLLPFTWSDNNQSPSTSGNEHVLTFGGIKVKVEGGKITVDGKVVFNGEVHVGGEGGKAVHRKDDLDSDGDAAVGCATKLFAN